MTNCRANTKIKGKFLFPFKNNFFDKYRSPSVVCWSISSNFRVSTSAPTGESKCSIRASKVLGKLCWEEEYDMYYWSLFCDSWEFPTLLIKIPSTYWSFIRESILAAMERRMLWRVLGSSVQRILATGLSSKKNKLVVKVSSHSSFMLTLESFVGVDCMHWLWSVMLTRTQSRTKETSSWRAWRERGSNSCNLTFGCWSCHCKPCFLNDMFESQQPWSGKRLSRSVSRKTLETS